jgi:DNA-binding NarL/FixJ family response regulator
VIVVALSLPTPGACELIRALRIEAPTRRSPIIALNGFGYQQYSDEALQAGCCCVPIKPCLPEVLANEIQRALQIEPQGRTRSSQSLRAAS